MRMSAIMLVVVGMTVALAVPGWSDYYVATNGGHVYPYTNWGMAARVIQEAADAAPAGATIWVADGRYDAGGHAAGGQELTSRVAVVRSVSLRSVNGPAATFIVGAASTNASRLGPDAIRGVYLTNGAMLVGFTVTNGHTQSSWTVPLAATAGGVFCETWSSVSNCVITGNVGSWGGGGTHQGTLYDCRVVGNTTRDSGGGASGGTLYRCTLVHNTAVQGGGAYMATLYQCVINSNTASFGGGAADSSLYDCTVAGNGLCSFGGGLYDSTANNCQVVANSAAVQGGGADGGTLEHCLIIGNSAGDGGGVAGSTLVDSLLSWNTVTDQGGGAYLAHLHQCILSNNTARQGGGAAGGHLSGCRLAANGAAERGGGVHGSVLTNCLLLGNTASHGGGAYAGTLYSSILLSNTAAWAGGGAVSGRLYNCTLAYNSAAGQAGGGIDDARMVNCIAWQNTAPSGANWRVTGSATTILFSCTSPLPPGSGNTTNDPRFLPAVEVPCGLASNSPCINAGTNMTWMPGAADYAGNPRIIGPSADQGAFEYLLAVPDLSASTNSSVCVELIWTGVQGAGAYLVYRAVENMPPDQPLAAVAGGASSYCDTTTIAGLTYYYWVRAQYLTAASACSPVALGRRLFRPLPWLLLLI